MATQDQLVSNRERALNVLRSIQGAASAFSPVPNGAVGLYVRYKGPQDLAAVAVDATTGDLAFTADNIDGLTTADATIQIGATPGTIDVSDAAGNTMGEVVDAINASDNWEAILVDALRQWSSVNTLATLTAANSQTGSGTGSDGVQSEGGVALLLDLAETDVLYGSSTWAVPVSVGHEHVDDENFTVNERLSMPANLGDFIKKNELDFFSANVTSALAAAGEILFEVWEEDANGAAAIVFGPISTGVATAVDSGNLLPGDDLRISLRRGRRLVAVVKTATAEITACNVTVVGKSVRRGHVK